MKRKPAHLHLLKENDRPEIVASSEFQVAEAEKVASGQWSVGSNRVAAAPALPDNRQPTTDNRSLAIRNSQLATSLPTNWRQELKVSLSIMKPITWVPVVWSFWCGAVAAGGLNWSLESIGRLMLGLLLSGPLLCGMGQAINDWFDREVDAVNEPNRPIPSGQLSVTRIYQIIGTLGFFGLLTAFYLGPVVMVLALFGIFMAHNYSAPPLRLKAVTWLGPLCSAVSYILVPWLAAASIFGGINWRSVVIPAIYTIAGTGIMILNDFKSIRGDYQLKLPSVPVVYGTHRASRMACLIIDGAQLTICAFLLWQNYFVAAGIVVALLIPQLLLQLKFIEKPLARAVWYNARAQNFLVLGMLVAAWIMF